MLSFMVKQNVVLKSKFVICEHRGFLLLTVEKQKPTAIQKYMLQLLSIQSFYFDNCQ